MAAKKVVLLLVVVVTAFALAGCAGMKLTPGVPGGPIIVIEPVPDPSLVNYQTDWLECCPEADCPPTRLESVDTYTGLPGRFGREFGAEKIVVTLKSNETFNAKTIKLTLVDGQVLTISLPDPNLVPTWTLDKPAKTSLKTRWYVPRHNWSHALYGRIKQLEIIDSRDTSSTVEPKDLVRIQIFYNRKNRAAPYCK